MQAHHQDKQRDRSQKPVHPSTPLPWKRIVLALIGISLIIIIGTLNIQASVILTILGVLLALFQWLFPLHPHAHSSPPVPSPLPPQQSSLEKEIIPSSLQSLQVQSNVDLLPTPASSSRHIDWGEAPESEQFYGREKELVKLKQWLLDDHCRLVAILGMGGMGKTSLAATMVDQVQEHYDCVFWRSLHNAPLLESILQECIQFVSDQQRTILPAELDRQITLLIEYLRTRRCLLVLDNVESILQGRSQVSHYREGYEGYGRLLQRIGESRHQSCLLVTSREKPQEVALLEGEAAATRSYHLVGLPPADGREILNDKGLQGTEHTWEALITHYGGNPLALKLVGQVIREVFGGSITTFLKDGEVFFRDIRDVLEQQVERLSALEEEIIYWLAIEREAISLDDLQDNIVHSVSKGELQEALRSLRRRHLIEASATGFTIHPVIMEYLTNRFVDRVCEELKAETLVLFERHAVLLAQAKDYLRESQHRLILQPLVQRLLTLFGKEALEQRLKRLLAILRERHDDRPSYAAGNVLNLLIQLGCTLRGYDFSHLVVRQAYLQEVELPEVNFAHANLATSVFTDAFGSIPCVTFSKQGDLLAAGTVTGEIRVWHAGSGLPLHTFAGHTDWVWSVAFSPDGSLLASGSVDQMLHVWEVSSGQLLHTLQGHLSTVRSVAFSPDGSLLASGNGDRRVRLWEVSSGQLLHTLQGHTETIPSVVFSPDGSLLASGSDDRTIRLWETSSFKLLTILDGHTGVVHSVAFSPDGKLLASGSFDQTVRLWDVSSGQLLHTLDSHPHQISKIYKVYSVAFSPDGKLLASGSADRMVRLWGVSSGQLLHTLQGHTSIVRSLVFNPDGKTLASGSADRTVRLWEVSSGKVLHTLQGYTNRVLSVAFSPDGKILASGHDDRRVCLWEVSSGKVLSALHGHSHWVRSVAFSPDGSLLVSGSEDRTVRLWELNSGKGLQTLQGHTAEVSSVAFNPDGKTVASGSTDRAVRLWEVNSGKGLQTLDGHSGIVTSVAFSPDGKVLASADRVIRLWDVGSGQLLKMLQGHLGTVYSMAFSPGGNVLASGSGDRTIRLWELGSGKALCILQGHTEAVHSVAFSPDGSLLASSGFDQTVLLWEVSSRKVLNTLQAHLGTVWSVAFSPDGSLLASGGFDQTVLLWEVSSGKVLHTLRSDRPYERMNITQVKGLTEGQKTALRLLGAIEEEG